MSAQLEIYKDTQNELTAELADFKEKYREILDLLHDAQDEIKDLHRQARSKYSGLGQHNVVIKGGGEDQDQVLMDQGSDDADDDDDSTANLHSFDTNFSGNFKQQPRPVQVKYCTYHDSRGFRVLSEHQIDGTLCNISPELITYHLLFVKLHWQHRTMHQNVDLYTTTPVYVHVPDTLLFITFATFAIVFT